MSTGNRKSLILDALRAFINQRSGIEFGNYGDVKAFRAEQRGIQKDRRAALELLRAVELSSEIGADELIKAAQSAYSGRLTIVETLPDRASPSVPTTFAIDYCTGQYFPTEYRRAACAVLASALWEYTREHCMPEVTSYAASPWGFKGNPPKFATLADAKAFRDDKGGSDWGYVDELHNGKSAGDWLRAHFLRQFGRGIASRWFT